MNVLIVAEYLDNIQDPKTYNSRFFTVADCLMACGHSVRIVTTNFIHGTKQHVTGVTSYKNCELVALPEPGYPKNICLKRFYSHFVLSQNLKGWLKTIEKPDLIYCAVPSLDFAYEAAKYAKKERIRFVLDIQDLWPEAFEMVVNIPIISKLCFLPFRIRANKTYSAADQIVAVSQTYANRALQVNKKCKSACVVYLGTNLEQFDSYKSEAPALKKDTGDIWLGYVGTLGRSYDLKTVIDSMLLLRDKPYYKKLKLMVAGDGPLRQVFENYATKNNVHACFTGRLPYPQMVSTLCQCDIAVNPIRRNSAGSIINKHADYAAAGIPVINSQESPEYRKLVDDYGMGLNCKCENAADMAEKLSLLIETEGLIYKMGFQARRCAQERFDRSTGYATIMKTITQIM